MTNGTVSNGKVTEAEYKAAVKKNEVLFSNYGEKKNFLDTNIDEFYMAMNWTNKKVGSDYEPNYLEAGKIFISRGTLTRGRVQPVTILLIIKWFSKKERKEILDTWHLIDKYLQEQKYNV